MIIRIGKSTGPRNAFHGFCVYYKARNLVFEIKDKETDDLLYWYVTEVMKRQHEYGWWELEIDL